ncbi:MAG: pantoate--beta-alanine ligase [Vicinamibacterales bacterium]
MTHVDRVADLRQTLARARHDGRRIGFVPTMGALHAGHARLIARARDECDTVVVSLFVNPLQFDRADDLERYPRTLEADTALCASLGTDVLFVPAAGEMYPTEPVCRIDVGRLGTHLCGARRPGHFNGVAVVVMKLFQMIAPDRAYFGEKDAQQLGIIRRLVQDFDVPVEVVGVPTVREADGLALSSRNRHLSADERLRAPALHRALLEAARLIDSGLTDAGAIVAAARAGVPEDEGLRVEYLDIVDPDELQPVPQITGPVLVAGALWVGHTRLIDNLSCTPPAARP